MSVRANWNLGDLERAVEESEAMSQIQQLKSEGKIIDLSRTSAEIQDDLRATVEQEARYARGGLECELKWSPDHKLNGGRSLGCFNCPKSATSSEDARGLLCELGRRQEELNEEARAVTDAEALDHELVAAFERDVERCHELAEAILAA